MFSYIINKNQSNIKSKPFIKAEIVSIFKFSTTILYKVWTPSSLTLSWIDFNWSVF